jgi:purine-cytosine permease-like protein
MTPNRILLALLPLMMLDGALDATYDALGHQTPIGWTLAVSITFSFLCFAWYRYDSDERHYARSRWLNTGMLVLIVFALPYYLVRSRPRGARLRAILKCVGFALLLLLATAAGMLLSGHGI